MARLWIGKCRRCGTARVEAAFEPAPGTGPSTAVRPLFVRLPNGQRCRVHTSHALGHHFGATCLCGQGVTFVAVRGRTTKTACGSRCMGSTGHVCDCSCGGKNHGVAHAG